MTLFDSYGDVDADATAALALRLVDLGMQSVLVAGTTGEAPALSTEERAKIVRAVRAVLPVEIALIAGSGASFSGQAIEMTKSVLGAGADAVLVLSPPQSSDPRNYYDLVANAADGASVLAYHCPTASAPGIPVSVLPELPVVGLKDSSGDLRRLYDELDVFSGQFYTGSTDLVLIAGALKCAGAILAIANLEPELSIKAFAGDGNAQRQLTTAAHKVSSRRPQGLKEAVAARFGTSAIARMG